MTPPNDTPTYETFTPPKSDDLNLPAWWKDALDAYFDPHQPAYLTDSTQAVLHNDLHKTFLKADSHTRRALVDILTYIERMSRSEAWGSRDKVDAWLKVKNANWERAKAEQAAQT